MHSDDKHSSRAHCCSGHGTTAAQEQTHIDPVCGMTVKADPQKQVVHEGKTYYFCSMKCIAKFSADPASYLHRDHSAQAAKPADDKAIYTCPMHPEVQQVGPGSCPLCGMALEPMSATLEEDTSELDDMKRRLAAGTLLTLPLLAIAMGGMVFPHWHRVLPPGLSAEELQAALATPVVLWGGWPFMQRAWVSFRNRSLNMFSLIGLGVAVAYFFSLATLFAPQLLPAAFRTGGMAPVYFEAAAVIVTLALLGQVLELRARARTNSAVKALLALAPDKAIRVRPDGRDEEVALDRVRAGDILRVRPGTNIPVDGTVTEGHSGVDESMLTGEAMPATKDEGSKVSAGTVNLTGAFLMRADKVGADTLLARIVDLVNQASRSRAPIQKMADRVSGWFVPAVIVISLLAFAVWAAVGPQPSLSHALLAAVSVLIIACPCALGLATPISIMVGIGRGAREGILIKDAESLELMEKVDTLVVDKTGTLTEGKPAVQEIVAASGFDRDDVMLHAAALERSSEHPLARAIVAQADPQRLPAVEHFESNTGKGVRGHVGGRPVALGNRLMMDEARIDIAEIEPHAERLRAQGRTVIYVGIGSQIGGVIGIADPVKSSTPEAIDTLKRLGVHVVLLTGDNAATAGAVAAQLGIDEVHAGMLPEDKFRHVQTLQKEGRIVAMAGDGINDAPALAQANVGIAMGSGADVALNSARVVLVKGDLRGIVKAMQLSRKTMRNIRQNLFFAFFYNFLGVPVAAGILYPWFGILLNPMIASAAMSASSVSVIANALRLKNTRL